MLAQEPWCFLPEHIGKLTDWQIEHEYAKPAIARAEELRKDFPQSDHPTVPSSAPGGSASSPYASARVEESDLGEPGSPSHRNWHLSAYMNGPLRYTPERAREMYERQLAQWKAEQGKGV